MAPADMPDFNVFDALGIPDPSPELSFDAIHQHFKVAMLCVHPDRRFAPKGVFPTVLELSEAYHWLVEADERRKNHFRFYQALAKYTGKGEPHRHTFFPELRVEGAPVCEVFTCLQKTEEYAAKASAGRAEPTEAASTNDGNSGQDKGGDAEDNDDADEFTHNPFSGGGTQGRHHRTAKPGYNAYQTGVDFDSGSDWSQTYHPRRRYRKRRSNAVPKARTAQTSNSKRAGTGNDAPPVGSMFIGWPKSHMHRQPNRRQAV